MSAPAPSKYLSVRAELDTIVRLLEATRLLAMDWQHDTFAGDGTNVPALLTALAAIGQGRLRDLGRVLAGALDPARLLHPENQLEQPRLPHDDPDLVLAAWPQPPPAAPAPTPTRTRRKA